MSKNKALLSKEIENYNNPKTEKWREIPYNSISTESRHLEGKILTIIDATITDEIQNKAVKDLIKSNFCSFINFFWRIAIWEQALSPAEENKIKKSK